MSPLLVMRPLRVAARGIAQDYSRKAASEWLSYHQTVPASVRYLLQMWAAAPAPYAFDGTVWASSSIFTGYAGEFSSSVSSFKVPTEGLGPLATGNHTVVGARHYTALNAL